MPFLFTQLCDLLSVLESLSKQDPPLLPARLRHKTNDTIKSWFISHHVSINSPDVDAVALLSALLPSKRTDRVYGIQQPRLSRCLRRWLRLGKTRWPQLDQWRQPGRGDLSDCVERVLQQAELPIPHNRDRVTLEQVDDALATAAARCRFSAPNVRAREAEEDPEVNKTLENIYHRLQSRDAKWFTRLILKDFSCLDLPEGLIYSCVNTRLPVAMQMYHDFDSAICELRNRLSSQMANKAEGGLTQQSPEATHLFLPKTGAKVGPPKWIKAKGGLKNALSIIDGRAMSAERKHDGEYCQIHIDLTRGEDCIQIFSKSGKDSTQDRAGVHEVIKDGLRIGRDDCRFSEKCILEGELLVYSDRTKKVLDFHKIRKHVSRSGSFLGTALDSQPHYWEHLMIVFYDVMLVDDEPVLHQPYRDRRCRLENLVKCIKGRSDVVLQEYLNFSTPQGPEDLKEGLACALVERWEGLVLKPSDEPYFNVTKSVTGRFPSCWIKLKKDCIKGLGDTADFVVIGAGYDVTKATKMNILNLRWTHFYIGCLRNKQDVLNLGAKPCLLVFDQVSDCIKNDDLRTLNNLGYIRAIKPRCPEARNLFSIEYASGIPEVKDIFRVPFVFDVAGSGFDKAPNRDMFSLRFPRVMKIHHDRDWKDCVGFEELQEMAADAMTVPPESTWFHERDIWVDRLDQIDSGFQGYLNSWDYSESEEEDADSLSVQMSTATASKSPRRSRAPAAPSLVRMDTEEMRIDERRLSTGEVVDRPTSQHSMASTTSRGSLPTPPTSSPLSHGSELRGSIRKRSADKASLEEVHMPSKKPRPRPEQQTNAATNVSSHRSTATISKKPLRETTNVTNQLPPSGSEGPPHQDGIYLKKDFSLLRKIPNGAEEYTSERQNKRRRTEEPFSPSRMTTASESTSTSTSQSSLFLEPESEHPPASHARTETLPSLVTPPSTAHQLPPIEVPDLRHCKVVLSPCLIEGHEPIRPVKDVLATLSVSPSSFCQALSLPDSRAILQSTAERTAQIILLVEPDATSATVNYMRRMLKNVPNWHPITFAVWDWRVLHVIYERTLSMNAQGGEMKHKDYSIVSMTWNADWEGKGAVELRWRDGLAMRVPSDNFGAME